ncbi:YceD family protein [Legionella waltersii]|uniref:Metal-binding protein n=1 Tax=Legionella waltersii TaxID=66969 RepID=A0A0W1ALX4_9GAMM|nr:metal-binding protein [Legionella waltersii]KTD82310.1 metal-binding protein [Legionella waltersii]SNV04119.1 metal-binding, possibly nucleic acid-binding protein [Legionella waltersii]
MIHLQELSKHGQQEQVFDLDQRLPIFVKPVCQLKALFHIESKDDYYLIHLQVKGDYTGICQRCLQEFPVCYDNATIIAVCRSDERAEQLLSLYECIVSSNWHVDLKELIIDELHLYAPQMHSNVQDCDEVVNKMLIGKT